MKPTSSNNDRTAVLSRPVKAAMLVCATLAAALTPGQLIVRLSAVPIGAGEKEQAAAALANRDRLQAALGSALSVRVAVGKQAEFPVAPGLVVSRRGTALDLRGAVLYLPKSSRPQAGALLTVSGCSAVIEGGTLFSQEASLATGPLLALRRDGRATDPGVQVRGLTAWGWCSGPIVETSGAECVTFSGCCFSQDGSGPAVRLLVDGSSTRTAFVDGCYLSDYGGGDVLEVQGDVQEVCLRDSYMAGKARGVVTFPRSAEGPGEVSGFVMDNVRFEGPGPAFDSSATWLADSSFRNVSLGPGPGEPADRPVVKTRQFARGIHVQCCRHLAGGPVWGFAGHRPDPR
jgi:hypothetical protein